MLRRLTLRSAARTARRAVPTTDEIIFSHETGGVCCDCARTVLWLALWDMNSQSSKARTLKVELSGDVFRQKTFPKIRLQGKWLEQLGFKPNGRVRIVPTIEGELLLKFVDEEAGTSLQLNDKP